MNEPIFDHEKLDVYRLSIEYVPFSYAIASRLTGNNRHARQWLRAAQSIPLNIAEGNGKHSLKDRSRFFDIARVSALECAAIHDILTVCHAIAPDYNLTGKSQLRHVVAMLTKLVARNESVSENPTVYQIAFEHEHEAMPEQINATKFAVGSLQKFSHYRELGDFGRYLTRMHGLIA